MQGLILFCVVEKLQGEQGGNPAIVSFLAQEFVLSLDCGENEGFQKEAEVSSKMHFVSSPRRDLQDPLL